MSEDILDEELDLDNEEELEEYDEETGEPIKNPKLVRKAPRQFVILLSEKIRVRFVEGNPNIFFEIKMETEAGEITYKNDGYFGEFYNALKYAKTLKSKNQMFTKGGIFTLEEAMKIIKESDEEFKTEIKELIFSIKNNPVLNEIADTALQRCKII